MPPPLHNTTPSPPQAQLSFVNLKQLFADEETVARARDEGEEEMEEEEDSDGGSLVTTQVMDWP